MDINLTYENHPTDPDLWIPFSVNESGNTYDIAVYEEAADAVNSVLDRFGDDLFSSECIEYSKEKLDEIYKEKGYEPDEENPRILYSYVKKEISNESNENVIKIESEKQLSLYENLCELDISEALGLHQCVFCYVVDNKIVSVAVENFTFDNETEIATETCRDYRKKGYSFACCNALCDDILKDGYIPVWKCDYDNEASVKLAQKLGFEFVQKEMYFCYFLIDGE